MRLGDYETKTTFYQDFSIADLIGANEIVDTYNRAFKEWKNNVVYLTELVMVLNHKLWFYYEHGNDEYAKLYNRLWQESDLYAVQHLKDNDLRYFFNVTD